MWIVGIYPNDPTKENFFKEDKYRMELERLL